jgi:uncharacterized protein (DUF1697 family)
MADLRRIFESLGLAEVETFIASGNLVFNSEAKDIRALELLIEDRLRQSLGYEVTTFLRTEEELAAIAKYEPFQKSHLRGAEALNVGFLVEPPGPAAKKLIAAFKSEIDDFHVRGREVYWLSQTKQSDSKFNNVRFEKMLNSRATWRGINTVRRLAAKFAQLETACPQAAERSADPEKKRSALRHEGVPAPGNGLLNR